MLSAIRRYSPLLWALWSATPAIPAEPAATLEQLVVDTWRQTLEDDPLLATRAGSPLGANRLPAVGLAAQRRSLERQRALFARARAIDAASLPRLDQITLAVLVEQLEAGIRERELDGHLIPITNRAGFHIEFPDLPQQVPLKSTGDYRNYIGRLADFGRYADDHIELMRAGLERGLTLPAVVLNGVEGTIEPQLVERPDDSLLFAPLRQFPEGVPAAEQESLREAARAAIRESVVPGYRRFLRFLKEEYLPAARGTLGAAALPNGRELYRHKIRYYTTLDATAESIHDLGQREVRRIRAEMDGVRARAKFAGDHEAFLKFLREDPRFYATSPEHLLKEVAYVLKRIDGQLPQLFRKLPRTPYGIREIPAYVAPRTSSAYYMQPAGDGSRAGFYYVNTYDLPSRPLFELEALSLHEAVPGHHLQIALSQELENIPEFRRFVETTVFVEGWALYAERLGLEVGFYEDPYSDFGRLSFEAWRACRLVVDTGIHQLGWTRQQAIDFMAENTALSIHNITAEVDRYIAWPGQALAYKMGELRIRELRQEAERTLGEAFDVREFHEVVLRHGAVPLAVLAENVHDYIRERQAATKSAGR